MQGESNSSDDVVLALSCRSVIVDLRGGPIIAGLGATEGAAYHFLRRLLPCPEAGMLAEAGRGKQEGVLTGCVLPDALDTLLALL